MTMRTDYKVICPHCKTEGVIQMSENDAPFSAPRESYTAINIKSAGGFYVEGYADWAEVFDAMKLRCIQCDAELTTDNLR